MTAVGREPTTATGNIRPKPAVKIDVDEKGRLGILKDFLQVQDYK
jgi:hypothetical protein